MCVLAPRLAPLAGAALFNSEHYPVRREALEGKTTRFGRQISKMTG